jgi:hypothetical protein
MRQDRRHGRERLEAFFVRESQLICVQRIASHADAQRIENRLPGTVRDAFRLEPVLPQCLRSMPCEPQTGSQVKTSFDRSSGR